jgi:hypothetical protein
MNHNRERQPRDFEAARSISDTMQTKHGLAPLDGDKLDELARMVVRFGRFRDISRIQDAIPSDTQISKVLMQTLKALEVLARLHDPAKMPQRHARSIIEERLPHNFDENGDFISLRPFFRLAKELAPALEDEIARQQSNGFVPAWHDGKQVKPARRTSTVLMGKKIPDAFSQLYPGAPFGGHSSGGAGQLSGPGYSFTHQLMTALGFTGITFEAIRVAKQNIR